MFDSKLVAGNGRSLHSIPWGTIRKLLVAATFIGIISIGVWVTSVRALPTGIVSRTERVAQVTGIPTFRITQVKVDESITLETNNFPAGQTFTVMMGRMGTQGINGIVVGTLNSGNGGSLAATFNIPAELKGVNQIAVRSQTAGANPYYAYNWFYNATTGTPPAPTPSPNPTPTPQPPSPVYTGIPTFKVCSVARGQMVTIVTNNFPASQAFTVTMGSMWTQGIGGTVVGTINSGAGGTLSATFNIPAALAETSRISIRAQTSQARPYFAYNWFWNTTASVCS